MDAVECAINRLMRKLEGNRGDLDALETICAALRESTNSSHNSASQLRPTAVGTPQVRSIRTADVVRNVSFLEL